MMFISRTLKLKGWVIACILTLVFLYFVSRNSFIPPNKQTNVVWTTRTLAGEAYNRLSASHQQLLNSALAHIRLGYVANRTPDVSTPPLLVLYGAHQQQHQKSLDERLIDITNSYYFSMLQPGSAFAYDMTWPVKMEWYFEPAPSYMAMNTHQAQFYKDKTQPHEIEYKHHFTEDELLETPFMEHFAERGIKIVSTTTTGGGSPVLWWMTLRENPSMQGARDKYRLNHLMQKSDWFWLTSRLLFSRPASGSWFAQQLEPYRDMMGGRLDYSESYSPLDPHARKVTPEFAATKPWLRVGLRIGDVDTDAKEIHALTAHIAHLCQKQQQQSINCHVFISASNRDLLQAARSSMAKHKIAVHAIAEGYPFAGLNEEPTTERNDEAALKKKYARTFMDWLILSRMDYLVGQQNDGFLKTAAWAAQVQTDVSIENGRIIPMSDW